MNVVEAPTPLVQNATKLDLNVVLHALTSTDNENIFEIAPFYPQAGEVYLFKHNLQFQYRCDRIKWLNNSGKLFPMKSPVVKKYFFSTNRSKPNCFRKTEYRLLKALDDPDGLVLVHYEGDPASIELETDEVESEPREITVEPEPHDKMALAAIEVINEGDENESCDDNPSTAFQLKVPMKVEVESRSPSNCSAQDEPVKESDTVQPPPVEPPSSGQEVIDEPVKKRRGRPKLTGAEPCSSGSTSNQANNFPTHDVFSACYTFDKSKFFLHRVKTLTVSFNGYKLSVPLFLVDAFNLICLHVKAEGLFQTPSNVARIKHMRYAFFGEFGIPEYCTLYDVCGLVRYFLRHLKEPLLTEKHEHVFLEVHSCKTIEILEKLKDYLTLLPIPHRDALVYLAVKLKYISSFSTFNCATTTKIATYVARSIFRPALPERNKLVEVTEQQIVSLTILMDYIGLVLAEKNSKVFLKKTNTPEVNREKSTTSSGSKIVSEKIVKPRSRNAAFTQFIRSSNIINSISSTSNNGKDNISSASCPPLCPAAAADHLKDSSILMEDSAQADSLMTDDLRDPFLPLFVDREEENSAANCNENRTAVSQKPPCDESTSEAAVLEDTNMDTTEAIGGNGDVNSANEDNIDETTVLRSDLLTCTHCALSFQNSLLLAYHTRQKHGNDQDSASTFRPESNALGLMTNKSVSEQAAASVTIGQKTLDSTDGHASSPEIPATIPSDAEAETSDPKRISQRLRKPNSLFL